MAAIPAVAAFIGAALLVGLFGAALPGVSVGGLLARGVASYALGIAGVWVFGKVAQALAPRFGGTGEEAPAMKPAAYSPTAGWLAGVFAPIAPLSVLVLLGFYSLHILHRDAPIVTEVPEKRALVFTLALVTSAVLINILIILGMSLIFTP